MFAELTPPIPSYWRNHFNERARMTNWNPIETAPRDGRHLLMTDGEQIQICYPKRFPRPPDQMATPEDAAASKPGDVWEYFRTGANASWSMRPTHWMELPSLPKD